ncbi:lysosomal alpha-glucosidase-like, partial [Ruditapes philippinarum]|uniref:lysosomal alpha-glucosidase-like n=1 Tax=Ruditapes philippinarum TaxID=129788 RepID=UPI00295BE004
VVSGKLYTKTICASAKQKLSVHYNLHNLYGFMETKATYYALKELPSGKRPFIISRATFAGQGHYGGHWTGDNVATFHDLYRSISAILTMNLAGIPMVGADICGFNGNTTYELCLRWYQLGAFFPFSRSHNSDTILKDQDPGAFDDYFATSVRDVYMIRYSLLPYLYTLFYESYKNGTPVARAMFYEFPSHKDTYHIDSQFMWGPALLIVPVITKNSRKVEAYLPADSLWYSFYSGLRFKGKGENITLSAPLNSINLLVKGGTIIPMQEPGLTTSQSIQNEFSLLVSLGFNGTACGSLYKDDGDSQKSLEAEIHTFITFHVSNKRLQSTIVKASYLFNTMLKNITIFGIDAAPEKVIMNGASQVFSYNTTLKVLKVPSLNSKVFMMKPFVLDWM